MTGLRGFCFCLDWESHDEMKQRSWDSVQVLIEMTVACDVKLPVRVAVLVEMTYNDVCAVAMVTYISSPSIMINGKLNHSVKHVKRLARNSSTKFMFTVGDFIHDGGGIRNFPPTSVWVGRSGSHSRKGLW